MKNSDKMQRLSANKFYSFVRNHLFSGLNREAITWASHPNRFYVKAIISDTFCISVVWFKILIENRGKTRPTLFCPQAVVFPSVSHIRACINKEGQRQVRSHHWSCTSYFTFYENRTPLHWWTSNFTLEYLIFRKTSHHRWTYSETGHPTPSGYRLLPRGSGELILLDLKNRQNQRPKTNPRSKCPSQGRLHCC